MNIPINHTTLYYEEYGQGIPVLCLHGFCVDSQLMKGCLEPVWSHTAGYRRIYVDLVGMGQTPADSDITNSDGMLNLLCGFIDHVIGDTPFILFGESYGGYLSLGLSQIYHTQIKGICFICPCVRGSQKERMLPAKQVVHQESIEVKEAERSDFANFLNMAVVVTPTTWQRHKQEILPGIRRAQLAYLNSLSDTGYTLSCESDFDTLYFEKPTLFLLGRQDHIVGYEDALQLRANFPHGTFVVIDGAGHNLQIEIPELFSALVEDFLKRIQ